MVHFSLKYLDSSDFSQFLSPLFTKFLPPIPFLAYFEFQFIGMWSNLSFSCFSCISDLSFQYFWEFLGFLISFFKIVGVGFQFILLYFHALHSKCILTLVHAFF